MFWGILAIIVLCVIIGWRINKSLPHDDYSEYMSTQESNPNDRKKSSRSKKAKKNDTYIPQFSEINTDSPQKRSSQTTKNNKKLDYENINLADRIALLYGKLLLIVNNAKETNITAFELLPFIYILLDCAAVSYGQNRLTLSNEVLEFANNLSNDCDINFDDFKEEFYDRVDLYGEIIRGEKELRAEWYLGEDITPLKSNYVTKCITLLGDIIKNPDCVYDYENAPLVIGDIFDSFNFAKTLLNPVMDECVKFVQSIKTLEI